MSVIIGFAIATLREIALVNDEVAAAFRFLLHKLGMHNSYSIR